jgi:NAD(P)-dependent dehydrogenase (short-subunit alcohol dehydrogenase family)
MTRAGALDLGRRNIRVNTVSPGPMDTAMFRAHVAEAPDPAAFLKRREDRQPLGFVLDPRQVANAVVFLLSNQSDGITGINLPVDAGLTAGFEFRNLAMSGGGTHHGGG